MQNNINCKSAEICNQQGVFLVKSENNGSPCWFYLLAEEAKLAIFKGLTNFFPLNISLPDYGKIIASGDGKNPPQNIMLQIQNGDFSDKNPAVKSEVFCLLADDSKGREFYTYLDVPYYLIARFKAKYAKKIAFELTNYGEVLHSDWGRPSKEIITMMKEKFGIETPEFLSAI